jgi:FixJ family two-component response regulator
MMPIISVVDDDISVRRSLDRLMRSVSLGVKVFASAEEFLDSDHPCEADCLILDVRLPGLSGIELHRHLLAQRCCLSSSFERFGDFRSAKRGGSYAGIRPREAVRSR